MHARITRINNVSSHFHTESDYRSQLQSDNSDNSRACTCAYQQKRENVQQQQTINRRFASRQMNVSCCLFVLLFFFFHCQLSYALNNDNNNNNGNREPNANPAKTVFGTTQNQNYEQQQQQSTKPNIVIILIDDMGFNDISFHGSNQILTPNIDALAYNGIILNRYYVPNLCTPSRATLLTGKYPIHTGTQHYVIVNDEPWGLPLTEHLMPEIFRDAGYSTNLIGKWHLGFWKKELTPTMRGFDYHYGYYSGYIDYYDYNLRMLERNYSFGLDLRRNLKPWREANGSYATDEFTQEAVRVIKEHDVSKPLFMLFSHLAVHTGNTDDPLQAPDEEVNKFAHITDDKRRTYAGMVSRLDQSVGKTIRALADKGILNNTIVLLYSDNGAPTEGMHANSGSNYPFRGQKASPWEGGLRSAGLIWSPLLQKQSYVSNQVIHASDWLPTFATAANISLPAQHKLDGIDQWATLSQNLPPQSRSVLHALDDEFEYASYMRGNLKYVNGTTSDGDFDYWFEERIPMLQEEDPLAPYYIQTVLSSEVHTAIGQGSLLNVDRVEKLRAQATHRCTERSTAPGSDPVAFECKPLKAPCLFNIEEDPCERYNLAQQQPSVLAELEHDVAVLRASAVPSARVARPDPNANPALHNGTWEWWDHLGKNGAQPLQPHSIISSIWFGVYSGLQWLRH